jgi:hypothetical protein
MPVPGNRNAVPNLKKLKTEELTTKILGYHNAVCGASREAIQNARWAGQGLRVMKERLDHGEWGKWLDANFPKSQETASHYMRIDTNWKLIEPHLDELTIRSLKSFLVSRSRSKKEAKPEIKPEIKTEIKIEPPTLPEAERNGTPTDGSKNGTPEDGSNLRLHLPPDVKPEPEPEPEKKEPEQVKRFDLWYPLSEYQQLMDMVKVLAADLNLNPSDVVYQAVERWWRIKND